MNMYLRPQRILLRKRTSPEWMPTARFTLARPMNRTNFGAI